MLWPFRRNRGDRDSDGAAPRPSDAPAERPRAGEWRDLPSATTVLGPMPATLDPAFSRTLPTRWQVPPALGPLGHDVRPELFGGLVSQVASSAQPRVTDPAGLVWRTGSGTGSGTRARVPRRVPRAVTTTRPGEPPIPSPRAAYQTPQQGPSAQITDASAAGQVSAPRAADPRHWSKAEAEAEPKTQTQTQPPAAAAGSGLDPAPRLAGVRPRAAADAGTVEQGSDHNPAPHRTGFTLPQTRRALPVVVAPVEARDHRPGPADVTDGSTTTPPDAGADIRTAAGPLVSSSPSAVPFGPPPESAPREARPGRDSRESAPAAAPADAPAEAPFASAPMGTSIPYTVSAAASPGDDPAPGTAPIETVPIETAPTRTAPTKTAPTASAPTAAAPPPTAAISRPEVAEAGPAAPSPPSMPSSSPPPSPSPSWATTPAPPAPAPGDSPVPEPAPVAPARASAPLISMAGIARTATAINRLLPPSRPVGQPVRPHERIIDRLARAAVPPSPAPLPSSLQAARLPFTPASRPAPPPAPAQVPVGPLPSPTRLPPALSASFPPVPPFGTPADTTSSATSDTSAVAPGPTPDTAPGPDASAPTTTGYPTDPAALDLLARRLYGRFSRRLADELLAERERAQFLTDLA